MHITWLTALLLACTGPNVPEAAPLLVPTDPLSEPVPAVEATVHVISEGAPGVELAMEDGKRVRISEVVDPVWKPFDGLKVKVTGNTAESGHFEVETLQLIDMNPDPSITMVGPLQTLSGQFETQTGEPGSKMAKGSWTVFNTTGGRTHKVWWSRTLEIPTGTPVTITARAVNENPMHAHMRSEGDTLWIRSVTPSGEAQ